MRSFYRAKPKKLLVFILVISFLFLIYQVYHLTNLSSLLSPTVSTTSSLIISNNLNQIHSSKHLNLEKQESLNNNSPQSGIFIAGVSPNDVETYRMAFEFIPGKFQCLQSKELIEKDLVNDDYCDCSDGSDEPSTSACSHLPNSRFYCKAGSCNQPGEHSIPSSRVNDGICDCCDGSDEMNRVADKSTNQYRLHMSKYINPSALNSPLQACFN